MYEKIASRASVPKAYEQQLLSSKLLDESEAQKVGSSRKAQMEEALAAGETCQPTADHLKGKWSCCVWPTSERAVHNPATGLNADLLKKIGKASVALPEGFNLHSRLNRHIKQRLQSLEEGKDINWATAEALAFGSILAEGKHIRLSGEDVQRGTFSQRHAALVDQKTEAIRVPLNVASLASEGKQQGKLELANSSLSEEAVLGFEVGISWDRPDVLPIWEAQFGDFANGAQVVIDQFISSGEAKWGRLCGLTMLLPHGYEGQGPEHSSARLERFLQLCAEHNMQVCVPSTPAQIYHLLRRQAVRPLRKPLVIMSPKSLLRHKKAISTLEELADGIFRTVLDDPAELDRDKVKRVVMCSGKVYYDLLEKRDSDDLNDTALIRVEQLYPFPEQRLQQVLEGYPNLETLVWCQEEPMNQGAWYCSQHHMYRVAREVGDLRVHYAGRDMAAAPAAGSMALHVEQQQRLVQDAFEIK